MEAERSWTRTGVASLRNQVEPNFTEKDKIQVGFTGRSRDIQYLLKAMIKLWIFSFYLASCLNSQIRNSGNYRDLWQCVAALGVNASRDEVSCAAMILNGKAWSNKNQNSE